MSLKESRAVQKLHLKSFQYFVTLMTLSILVGLLPILSAAVFGDIWVTLVARIIRYASVIFMCGFIYGHRADDVNLYIIPVSFLPFPIIHHFILSSVRTISNRDFGLSVWRTSTLFDTLSFILPMVVITCLISRYMERQKKKGAEYAGNTRLRKDFFVAAAIPASMVAACSISMVLCTFLV